MNYDALVSEYLGSRQHFGKKAKVKKWLNSKYITDPMDRKNFKLALEAWCEKSAAACKAREKEATIRRLTENEDPLALFDGSKGRLEVYRSIRHLRPN